MPSKDDEDEVEQEDDPANCANMYYDFDDDALYYQPQDNTSMDSDVPPPASPCESTASDVQ